MQSRPSLAVLAIAFSLAGLPAQSEVARAPKDHIHLAFDAVDAHVALSHFARVCGISIAVAPEVSGRVTTVFTDVPWPIALESLAASLGCQVVIDGDGIRRIEPRPPLPGAAGTAQAIPERIDDYTIRAPRHYGTGYSARPDGSDDPDEVQVVVEIPTGTTAKWEVDESDGLLRWEFVRGSPRVVQYLGYPGNYGMVPRTLQATADGGDGDPLDVLILGDPVPRGSVVRARVLGVLLLRDRGERDDKLIAVREGTPFADFRDLAALRQAMPGVLEIVETWFANYKGPNVIEVGEYHDLAATREVVAAAMRAFEAAHSETAATHK